MARLVLTPILAAAPTLTSAFSDQDFCSAARQFATAIERDVGIWVDRTTRNAGVGVFCERKSVEFWQTSASMDEAWQRHKAGDWNTKQCASLTWGDAIRNGWRIDLVVTSADGRRVAFAARCE